MKSIKYLLSILILTVTISCKNQNNKAEEVKKIDNEKKVENIDFILSKLDNNQMIEYLDLSNKNMVDMPNLSLYCIKKLDISNNEIDTIPLNKLPKKLEKLNASGNRIKNFGIFNASKSFGLDLKLNNSNLNLKEIDLSNNKLKSFNISIIDEPCNLKKVKIDNNDLLEIKIYCDGIQYLDISNNKNLSNKLDIDINIDTIIRNNIKNNLPLERLMPKKEKKNQFFN